VKATDIASTFPPPVLGVAAPPQALSKRLETVRTNRSKRAVFFMIYLFIDWISPIWSLCALKRYGQGKGNIC
jgi:hypothetical protein